MPRLADRLQALAPSMRIHLVDLVPDSYIETLERYDVDLALIPLTDLPDWVKSQPVFRSGFSVIARLRHPRLTRAGLTPGGVVPIDLFCDLGHVLFSPEGNSKAMGDAALAKVGRERRVIMTMPSFSGRLSCRRGLGSHRVVAQRACAPYRTGGRTRHLSRTNARPHGTDRDGLAQALFLEPGPSLAKAADIGFACSAGRGTGGLTTGRVGHRNGGSPKRQLCSHS